MKVHKDLKYIGTLEGVYYFREVDGSVVTGTESDMEKLAAIAGKEELAAEKIKAACAHGVCPDCGAKLAFGSRDPCEGDYYVCSARCGADHILFPLYHKVPGARISLIDADIEQAARVQRGAAAAIDSTIFADAKPFDPEQFVTDVIGS